MKMNLLPFELQLRHPFTISRGTITTQPTLVVELVHDGISGFGEATSNSYYGRTIDDMVALLESCRQDIESCEWKEPSDLWRTMEPKLSVDPFAQCALDQAAYDLWGKRKEQPVYQLLGWSDLSTCPPSNYTIGIDDPEKMASKLDEYPGWPVYKIKLGGGDDLAIIQRLREQTDARFRVDANGGWTVSQTLELAPQLADLGVELIEQPLHADNDDQMAQLAGKCPVPLIADESCQVPSDVKRCAENGFDGINIKLVKCGGMTPALGMMSEARELGLKLMVGCMTESSVGISAIAQLLPGLDFVDMDGAVLLAKDIAQGVRLERGRCEYPTDCWGNGVRELDRTAASGVA